jgi:hypothetical protein
VVVERALREPRFGSDLFHFGSRIAVLEEDLASTVEDLTLREEDPEIKGSPVNRGRYVVEHDRS